MPVLIDGNNLLFAAREVPRFRAFDPHQLCRVVGEWAARCQTEVTVVFDGPSPRLAVVQEMRSYGVDVEFAGGRSADDVIVETLEQARATGTYTVVSSDHAVQHAARFHRAASIESEDFVRELTRPATESEQRAPPAAPEKPDGTTGDETDEWLRRFGEDPDEPPDITELMT